MYLTLLFGDACLLLAVMVEFAPVGAKLLDALPFVAFADGVFHVASVVGFKVL